jgi:hypothetical protein
VKALSVALAAGLFVTGAACNSNTKSTVPGSSTALTAPSRAKLDDGCSQHYASTSIPAAPLPTLPTTPRTDDYSVEIAVSSAAVCPGGTVIVAARVHNDSAMSRIIIPSLVLRSESAGVVLAVGWKGFKKIGSHATATETATFKVPLTTPPGDYSLAPLDHNAADKTAVLTVRAVS